MASLILAMSSFSADAALLKFSYTTDTVQPDGYEPVTARGTLVVDDQFNILSAAGTINNARITGLVAGFDNTFVFSPARNGELVAFTTDTDINYRFEFEYATPIPVSGQADHYAIGTFATSPVPLPPTAPMFGAALLALGAIGFGLARQSRQAT
jgi:hypothetical protein